jgi:hypothetical protein
MIDILTHKELYSFESLERVYSSLSFAKNLPLTGYSDPTTFHFYWRVPKNFSRKQVLPIKSSIVTQNKNYTKFVLWSNVDLSNNEFIKPLLPYIELRIWDLHREVKDTPLENANFLNKTVDDSLCYLGGDLFRLLTLYKYGGVYIDMDVVVLRDFNPILEHEFMYQWGSTGTGNPNEPVLKQNGAIMRLTKKSKLSEDLLNELKITPANPNTTCWGTDLYHKVWLKNKNWVTFPCAWFNTEWGMGRTIQPFKKNYEGNDSSELFDGAFTWHWHNKWDEPIEDGSKFQILETIMNSKFGEL